MMRAQPLEKVGRNDRCPCGSGEKYKRCCLNKATVPVDTPWSRQREASDSLTSEMMGFAARRFGKDVLDAWIDYNQTPFPKPMDDYEAEGQLFYPYFLFDWDPEISPQLRGTTPGIVARAFLLEKAKRLPELERLILELSIVQPVSFYEILQCDPGRGMLLRDVLIGGETEVEEHSASRHLRPGDLAYAQLCPLPNVTTLSRTAPIVIPPGRKAEVIELRADLRKRIAKRNRDLEAKDLIRYSEKIRSVYLLIREALRTPPKLCNTDGDPLVFHTLTYQVGSAQVAFDALAPLAWGISKEDLLQDADLDGEGVLRSVNLDWIKKGNPIHETWDNTILGHLTINGRSLLVDVNSAKRAARIRKEIEKRLGILAVHLGMRVESPEQMLSESKNRKARLPASGEVRNDDPLFDPDQWEAVQAQMQQEIQSWVYKRIPALGGRTPMDAVKDPDGREIVEALLLDWERGNDVAPAPGVIRPDIGAVRRLLNL